MFLASVKARKLLENRCEDGVLSHQYEGQTVDFPGLRGEVRATDNSVALRSSRSPEAVTPISRFPYERLGDAELVEAVAHGDSQAVAVVWDRYSPLVRSVVRASLGPDSATEDLLQDVF